MLDIEGPETAFDAGDRPVLLDPYNDTWALLIPDKLTMDALEQLLPRVTDPELRSGVWNNVRSALHNAAVDPVDVLELAVASLPVEDTEDSRRRTMAWVLRLGAAPAARSGGGRWPGCMRRRSPPSTPRRPALRGAARVVPCRDRHVVRTPSCCAPGGGGPGSRRG